MKWSAFKEIVKTFAILAVDILGFLAILTLLVTAFVAAVGGAIVVLWFYLRLLF